MTAETTDSATESPDRDAAGSESIPAPEPKPAVSPKLTAAQRRQTSARSKTRAKARTSKAAAKPKAQAAKRTAPVAKFPRHPVERALRIPRAILDQNAGHPSSSAEAAKFFGGKATGEFQVEVSSAKKYGFLDAQTGKLTLTDRAKQALRPQNNTDEINALQQAVLEAPDFKEVYNHYRGESLPDDPFFSNALTDTFKIPLDKISDFRDVFMESLRSANLIDESEARPRLIDVGREGAAPALAVGRKKDAGGTLTVTSDSTCFVMQPFAHPYGGYYETIFKRAIEQAGITPVRADNEIFGAGKIMDQVWRGIRNAKVLVAELTTRNANVYYELGLAHALGKPVVLIAAKGEDVPFDIGHIRVVYYDVTDPFWGDKLINKVADNIKSALNNPEEAVLDISS
jgi:hypothetical protein